MSDQKQTAARETEARPKRPYHRPRVVMREALELIAAACNSGVGTAKEGTDQGCAVTNLMS